MKGSKKLMIIRNNDVEKFEGNYFTHNRKLKLEEYDDNGNLIDVIEFSKGDLWNFYMFKNNYCTDLTIARKKDREYFKGKELELAKRMLYVFNDYYFDENTVKDIETLFKKYTVEEIEFALNLKDNSYHQTEYNLSMRDYNEVKRMKFSDILNWIKNSEGIYYAVSNDGIKGMTFLEKPTKKQAKYQRQHNGKRIIFLNFRDWKEYLVNESELG